LCPACRRIRDRYPAGEITLQGRFYVDHAGEILRLVRNVEDAEHREHPLQRIIGIERAGGKAVVTTTDLHVARRIAHALEAAWHGELDTHYDPEGYFVRITWERDS